MKVVVPAAGAASRFVEGGYTDPKPLITVGGKPLIKWATDSVDLHSSRDQFIFIVREEDMERHSIDRVLTGMYPDSAIVSVDSLTEGAACTVLLARDLIDSQEDLLIVNCDTAFKTPLADAAKRWMSEVAGIVTTFDSTDPRFSFAKVDDDGFVTEVAEKRPISDRATVGAYYFTQGAYFVWAADQMITKDVRVNNEFYVAPTYNELIAAGHKVRAIRSDWLVSLGTPEEVEDYAKQLARR